MNRGPLLARFVGARMRDVKRAGQRQRCVLVPIFPAGTPEERGTRADRDQPQCQLFSNPRRRWLAAGRPISAGRPLGALRSGEDLGSMSAPTGTDIFPSRQTGRLLDRGFLVSRARHGLCLGRRPSLLVAMICQHPTPQTRRSRTLRHNRQIRTRLVRRRRQNWNLSCIDRFEATRPKERAHDHDGHRRLPPASSTGWRGTSLRSGF